MTDNPTGAGRPPLPRPEGVKRRIISVTCTDSEWDELLKILHPDTRDRYEQINHVLTKHVQETATMTTDTRNMTVDQKIKSYLLSRGWTEGEVSAAQIYKGHGMEGYGWYVQPFGETAQFWGKTWADIEESMKDDMPRE